MPTPSRTGPTVCARRVGRRAVAGDDGCRTGPVRCDNAGLTGRSRRRGCETVLSAAGRGAPSPTRPAVEQQRRAGRMARATSRAGSAPTLADALVLNATYEPLCVVPQRRAIVLVL